MLAARADALGRRLLKKPPRARRFIKPGLSVHQFLAELTRQGASYAVLRWFEDLPTVEPGEDIDLLISDEHLALAEPLLSPYEPFPTTQKVDLYSVSGMRGTDYRGVPYFDRKLALSVLENAVLLRGHYKVPAPLDHLNSLAFHAAYHKGEASGLAARVGEPPRCANAEHDYLATLQRVAASANRQVELTLDGLDRYLTSEGHRPPGDLLERYQRRNGWLQAQLASERTDIGKASGLVSFFVRQRALPFLPQIMRRLDKHGFEVLHSEQLTAGESDLAGRHVRGGNWGQGPFPVSGGEPCWLVLTYDWNFDATPDGDGIVLNGKTSLVKQSIRRVIERHVPREQWFNPIHSSDHGWQTIHALESIGRADLLDQAQREIDRLEQSLTLPWPVVRTLQLGRRARVLLVQHPEHGQVVAKLFRPGAQRFLERELRARRDFGHLPAIPRLLGHGPNWLLTPLYRDTREHVAGRLPGSRQVQLTPDAMTTLAALVKGLREQGCFLLDLSSHNLLTDPEHGLLALDFEFLQQYVGPTPPLKRDATVRGRAPSRELDVPVYEIDDRWDLRVRTSVFHPAICGLPARDFFNGPLGPAARLRMRLLQARWRAAFRLHRRWRSLAKRRFVSLPRAAASRLLSKKSLIGRMNSCSVLI